MDTARAIPCRLADFKLCRIRPACLCADLVAGSACGRTALSGRGHGRDHLCGLFRGADRNADLRRCCLRQKRISTVRRAHPDLREKVGRQYHRVLNSARDSAGRNIDGIRRDRRLNESGAREAERRSNYSTNTSSRRLRIIGKAAITSRPAAKAISTPEIGRVMKTVASPRAISIARRKFSSISGPSTNASTSGAGSKSCLVSQYPTRPKIAAITTSVGELLIEYVPMQQNTMIEGNSSQIG